MFVRQCRLADAVTGGSARQSEHAAEVLQVDARSGEPAVHPAAPRSGLSPLAARFPAGLTPRKIRAWRGRARRALPRERGFVGSVRQAVARAVRLRAARAAGGV